MNDLLAAIRATGAPATITGETIFVGQWGIFCSLTGRIQARNVWDSSERYGLGDCNTPVDAIAANVAALCM